MEKRFLDERRRTPIVRSSLDDRTAAQDRCRAFDPTELDFAGLRVMLRPLHADDRQRYRDFLARLNGRDLRLRFGGNVDALQRSALARLVEADYDVAFVASVAADGSGFEIAGDARARMDPHPSASAEFGIVVRSDLQRLGLGRALLEKLIEGCRTRGVELLYGLVAPSNDGMLALARALGFDVEHVPGATTVVVSLHLRPRPSPSFRYADRRRTQSTCDVMRAA